MLLGRYVGRSDWECLAKCCAYAQTYLFRLLSTYIGSGFAANSSIPTNTTTVCPRIMCNARDLEQSSQDSSKALQTFQ